MFPTAAAEPQPVAQTRPPPKPVRLLVTRTRNMFPTEPAEPQPADQTPARPEPVRPPATPMS